MTFEHGKTQRAIKTIFELFCDGMIGDIDQSTNSRERKVALSTRQCGE
jgi:hypothetical protein